MGKQINYKLIDQVADAVARDDEERRLFNLASIALIHEDYELIKQIFGDEVKIELHMHKPFESMGYISIIGPMIEPNDPELFLQICKRSSNLEFYPRTDNCVQCNLTYHNLKVKA